MHWLSTDVGLAPSPAPIPSIITLSTKIPRSQGVSTSRHKTQLSSASLNLNITARSPSHSDGKWLAIKEDVRNVCEDFFLSYIVACL